MKISCNYLIKNLEGEPLKYDDKDATLGLLVSNCLLGKKTDFDTLKAFDLGRRFGLDEHVEMDKPDIEKLITVIEKEESLAVLAKGQIIEILKETIK